MLENDIEFMSIVIRIVRKPAAAREPDIESYMHHMYTNETDTVIRSIGSMFKHGDVGVIIAALKQQHHYVQACLATVRFHHTYTLCHGFIIQQR